MNSFDDDGICEVSVFNHAAIISWALGQRLSKSKRFPRFVFSASGEAVRFAANMLVISTFTFNSCAQNRFHDVATVSSEGMDSIVVAEEQVAHSAVSN